MEGNFESIRKELLAGNDRADENVQWNGQGRKCYPKKHMLE